MILHRDGEAIRNHLMTAHEAPHWSIYNILSHGRRAVEVPGYEIMKGHLWFMDAKLVTMDFNVWYILDMRHGGFVTPDDKHYGRPMPFGHIDDAYNYIYQKRLREQGAITP